MEQTTRKGLQYILTALRTLSSSIHKGLTFGIYESSGRVIAKQYLSLYQRTLQLLPDDSYLRDFLALDAAGQKESEEQAFQVMVICDQLVLYLQNLLDDETDGSAEGRKAGRMTEAMREQIVEATRQAVRRAFAENEDEDE